MEEKDVIEIKMKNQKILLDVLLIKRLYGITNYVQTLQKLEIPLLRIIVRLVNIHFDDIILLKKNYMEMIYIER
jgi:hypothetical protein